MEKIKVNNQVISMRKFVKMAKVRIINKLVKDVKALQMKKGTDSQLEKNNRKSQRLLSEIEIIKKIVVDDLSKRALLEEKDWESVLSNKEVSLEDRAFAMLANYETVQTEVKKFRQREPRLIALLPNLFKEWELRKANPVEKKSPVKASDIRKQRKEKLKRKKQPTANSPKAPSHKKAKISDRSENDENITSENGINCQISQENIASGSDGEIEESETHHEESAKHGNETTESATQKSQKNAKKKNHEMAVFSVNLSDLKEQNTIPSDRSSEEEEEESDKSTPDRNSLKDKDPFFASGPDPNKALTDCIEKNNPLPDNSCSNLPSMNRQARRELKRNSFSKQNSRTNHMPFKNRGKFPTGPRHNKPFNGERKFGQKMDQDKPPKGKMQRQYGNNKSSSFSKNSSSKGKNFPQERSQPSSKSSNESFHPSWEAKKRLQQKYAIVPSQAKKIKFD